MISFLLSILGFSTACSLSSCEYGSPGMEYGTPYATFKVKGSVKSAETLKPIPAIRVVMRDDTTYTDASGNYQVEDMEFPKDQSIVIYFEDTDGKLNGEYQSLDTIAEFKDPKFTGGKGGWDNGETVKELDVKLTTK